MMGVSDMNQFTNIKRTLVVVILVIAMIFSASIVSAAVEEYAHGELAYKYLEFIDENLPERIAFSLRERETAKWLVDVLIKMGHNPYNIYIQEFPAPEYMLEMITERGIFGEDPENLLKYSQNVILTIPGISDKIIIVGAHYDSVNNNGISDNASGTVVLLESAQRMLYLEHYYTIVYIFFGAEEVGLIGAEYYLNSLTEEEKENIMLMINIDVIFDGSVLFYSAGFHDIETSEMGSNAATLLIDEIAQNLNEELDLGLVSQHNGIYLPSDQLPFVWEGFNVVVFYAVDNFEPMSPGPVISFLETVLLVEAMVYGTDDPELIKTISERRRDLESTLSWWLDTAENFQENLKHLEQMFKEENSSIHSVAIPIRSEELEKELATTKRIIMLLNHPKIEEFVFEYDFGPESILNMVRLIETMVYGTDDPELIISIYEQRESLENTLAFVIHSGTESLLRDIEIAEQYLREAEDPVLIEIWLENIEAVQIMIDLLDNPKIEEFVFKHEFEFTSGSWGYVLHTPNDNLTFINENWPGLIERALNAYSIFLESILTLPAQSLELVS